MVILLLSSMSLACAVRVVPSLEPSCRRARRDPNVAVPSGVAGTRLARAPPSQMPEHVPRQAAISSQWSRGCTWCGRAPIAEQCEQQQQQHSPTDSRKSLGQRGWAGSGTHRNGRRSSRGWTGTFGRRRHLGRTCTSSAGDGRRLVAPKGRPTSGNAHAKRHRFPCSPPQSPP
jgi:hypothetical protein